MLKASSGARFFVSTCAQFSACPRRGRTTSPNFSSGARACVSTRSRRGERFHARKLHRGDDAGRHALRATALTRVARRRIRLHRAHDGPGRCAARTRTRLCADRLRASHAMIPTYGQFAARPIYASSYMTPLRLKPRRHALEEGSAQASPLLFTLFLLHGAVIPNIASRMLEPSRAACCVLGRYAPWALVVE